MFTEKLGERWALLGQIGAINHAVNTDSSIAGIDMSVIRRVAAVLDMGVAGAGNVQIYWVGSAQANMNVQTNVAGSIPLTANTSNRISLLELRADQMPSGTRYARPIVITNTAASNFGLLVIGDEASYKPGNQFSVANTADQIIAT